MNEKCNRFDIKVHPKKRDSNIELFRIITMIMIVAHHYVVNSGLVELMYKEPYITNSIFLFIIGAWGKIGINCFVFITGYFMCKSNITAKKFAKLFCEIMFYRIAIYLVFAVLGYETISIGTIIKLFIPIQSVSDNFSGCYLLFFLFIPFINVLVNNINMKKHILLIILSLFTYSLVGSIPLFSVTMNYVSWFTVLYFFSSFVRLYPNKFFNKTLLWGVISIVSIVVSIVSIFVSLKIKGHFGIYNAYYFIVDSNKVLAVITSFSLFMFFKNIKIPYNKFINTVASSTFGVLLIHANSDVMRQWLWRDTLNNVGMYNSPYLYIHAIGSVLAIFTICILIDQARIRFIEKPFFRLWDRCFPSVQNKYYALERKLINKFLNK